MPFSAIGWAFEQKLPHPEKWTLFLLADYADQEGNGAIHLNKLCSDSGLTVTQARKAIAGLSRKKLIIVSPPAGLFEVLMVFYRLAWRP
jgi:hypothetical protein